MIKSYKDLKFYLQADCIMNEQVFPKGGRQFIDYNHHLIHRYLRCMRWNEYISFRAENSYIFKLLKLVISFRFSRLSAMTGFDIPINTLGYGVRIGHISTIVINGAAKFGNYCRIESNVVVGDGNNKIIGNQVYLAPNVSIAKNIIIADGCTVSAGSFLNRKCLEPNTLLGGVVAKPLKETHPWTDEEPYHSEYLQCENLRKQMYTK